MCVCQYFLILKWYKMHIFVSQHLHILIYNDTLIFIDNYPDHIT